MRKFNQKDEALVQAGVSIQIIIDSYEITIKEAVDSQSYSKAAGYYSMVTGLKMAMTSIGELFDDGDSPIKNRVAFFNIAVNDRLTWIREKEKKVQ
jgi:hypothetical protein